MRASGRSAAWARYTLPIKIIDYMKKNYKDCSGVLSRCFEVVF